MKEENRLSSTRLAECLAENNLRAVDICEKTGISKSAMSLYLSGARIPNRDNADKLGKILCVNPVWLMGFDVEKEIPVDISNVEMDNQTKQLVLFFSQLSPEKQESLINLIKNMV